MPEIEIRIQVAAQALDIQQGLLQQHQLRLNLHVEAARDLEQPQQEMAVGNILQRLVEDRLAHRPDGRLEFNHARVLGNPAGLDMHLGHAPIIPVEEGAEVFRDVVFILVGNAADDAEVHGNVAGIRGRKDIAGVHVRVKQAVPQHLGEEDFNAAFGQQLQVDALAAQLRHITDGNSGNPLHDHDLGPGIVEIDARDIQHRGALEAPADFGGVGRLSHQVQFIEDGLFELRHHLDGSQAFGAGPELVRKPRHFEEQIQIGPDP